MANGDVIMLDVHRTAYKLLDAQSADSNGVWVEIPAWFNIRTYWADAAEASAALQIMVSNAETKPADGDDGVVSTTLSASTLGAALVEGFRWVKCKKTAGGTPAPSTVIVECARNQ